MKSSTRVKLISLGNAEAGKSCIIKRYCEKRFVQKYLTTIGIDYGVTKAIVEGRELKVNIFDMAGHPIFYEVRNEFYKDTQGALLVFDVANRDSYESLDTWLNEMRAELGGPEESKKVVCFLCGNKTDKKRAVAETEARLWAESNGFYYCETSALTGEGIPELFAMLFKKIIETIENGGTPPPVTTTLGYTKDQAEAIHRLQSSRDNYERLGLNPGATKEDINKAYRKLAVLLHPDKNVAPGSEEAFKILVTARTSLLQKLGVSS